ncbi:MAG: cupin domain-containing protein [Armatimonadota bacterium]
MKRAFGTVLTLVVVMGIITIGVGAQVGFRSTTLHQGKTTVVGQTLPVHITASIEEIAPGGEIGRHRRPNPTFVYVIEGTLTVNIDGHSPKTFAAGQFYLEAINLWSNAFNPGPDPTKLLVVYASEDARPPSIVRP